jgi:hypothetical protein
MLKQGVNPGLVNYFYYPTANSFKMKVLQKQFSPDSGWTVIRDDNFDHSLCNVVFAFGGREILANEFVYQTIKNQHPIADIVMNSTAGEIINTQVDDNTISLTAILFEKTEIKVGKVTINRSEDSLKAGKDLALSLPHSQLKHVMVISDGQKVNGSELVDGLQQSLPGNVIITGGLAGDGANFKSTLVGLNELPVQDRIVVVGFYGDNISTTYGSVGGWGSFGNERMITKSKGNILYELDGKPALSVYKNYLGNYANELPRAGLLFPLSIRGKSSENSLVRTILAVNENDNSLTFAGNMPEGNYARLMKANFDKLIEGASNAAQNSLVDKQLKPDLAILISCVGRRLILDQRIEEEIEVVRAIYGEKTAIAGFYSYGEISPSFNFMKCELHNQTMTITTFTEN